MRHKLFVRPIHEYLSFFCIFLTACTATPVNTTLNLPTTLQPLRVGITPALQHYRQTLNQCAQAQPNIALFIQETPLTSMNEVDSDLQLRLGLPNQGVDYAFQVGEENLQIVVNSKQQVQSISSDQIRSLFSGGVLNWEGVSGKNGSVHPWVYPEDNELGLVFEQLVMEGEHISPTASVAPDPKSMQQAIGKDEGAIGFLPSSWLTDTVHTVNLEHNLALKLKTPVLALTKSKPYGSLSIFVACLQEN
jgi:hypothetical protein